MRSAAILLLASLGAASTVTAQDAPTRVRLVSGARVGASSNASPGTGAPFHERRLSLRFQEVPLVEALNQVAAHGGLHLLYSADLIPVDRRVSISLEDVPALEAMRRVLAGQGVRMLSSHNLVVLAPAERVESDHDPAREIVGEVTGRVTDAATGALLSAVSIVVEGTNRGALTDAGGRYRITDVPAGRQQVSAITIGYKRMTQEIEVPDGGVVALDFALDVSAVALDRVVATGSVSEVRVREMASPVSVLDAREIEQRQVQRIDQLFRGAIPGAVAWDLGPYNYYSEIAVRGKNSLYFDYIKTYVDGVEVASPHYIATLDPNAVERIEVVRGPQASTLYGSDAAGGVLQIFTRKGTPGVARPQVTAKLSAGVIESDYVDDTPVMQEHSVMVSGGGQDFSYNLGGTYLTMDEYVPEAYTDNTSVFGALRTSQGPLTVEFSGRYYAKSYGWPLNPVLRDQGYALFSVPRDETHKLRQSTVGLNIGYQLRPNWEHNLIVGLDRSQADSYVNEPRRTTPADTFVAVSSGELSRASIRYHTSLDFDLSDAIGAALTAGIDHNVYHAGNFYTETAKRNSGSLDAQIVSLSRVDYKNTGYFGQLKLGLADALFLTAGIRAEDNDNFGSEYGMAVAPRLGVSYSRPLREGVDAKLRVSWGKGIRAPEPHHKQEMIIPGGHFLANPNIGPEEQKGWDAGVDLVFARRASLSVTYYDQLAIDLIDQVLLDASGVPAIFQYQNVGEMSNTGWELEGTLNLRPVRLTGTFSTVTSKVEALAPNYLGALQVGDRNLKIPESSAGLSLTYDFLRGSATLDMTYIGSFVNTDWIALYGFYLGGDPFRGSERDYWMDYDPVTRFGLRVEQAVTNDINAFLRIENITGEQLGERDNTQVTAGRMTVIGVRVTR